jgi:hypothetical protein
MSGANHLTVHAPMLRTVHRPDATDSTARSALRPRAASDKFVSPVLPLGNVAQFVSPATLASPGKTKSEPW